MSQAGSRSAMSQLIESNGLDAAKPASDWRESVLVFVMVLLPVPLASILFGVGLSVTAG